MKRILLASAVSLFALPALATEPGGPSIGGPLGNGTNANMQSGVNSAISTGDIGSSSRARSNATGGAGGAGGAGGNARGGRASVTNNIGSGGGGNSGGGYPSASRTAPSIALGMATAYCQNSAGMGGSGPGFSFSAMFGKHDQDCVRYNYALALEAMGDREAAMLVMANNPEVNAALTESRNRRNSATQASVPAEATKPSYCAPIRGESTADRLMRQRQPSCQ